GDTRIFSPLLYQLSYGTVFVLRCKGREFFLFLQIFNELFCIFLGKWGEMGIQMGRNGHSNG
ncbi:hypothetical protein, partial [Duncaniella muris]|uniref:hypothetical protein n=1 Tax=Duncaniella muris TaxID=2094150 RepID=UPI0027120F52